MSVTFNKAFGNFSRKAYFLPFLSEEERGDLGATSRAWRRATQEFDVRLYGLLQGRLRDVENETIYIRSASGFHRDKLLDVIGQGGSKKAFGLESGKALLVPNMDVDPMGSTIVRWKRMVHEEVAMSHRLMQWGMLCPLSERVTLSLSSTTREGTVSAYVSESFTQLVTRGCFIIDVKVKNNSTWKMGKHYLFCSDEERLNGKNWDPVVDALLNDVAKICKYDIPVSGDSRNIAVVKKPSTSVVCQYEVRFFGFDFSDKHRRLAIPKADKTASEINPKQVTFQIDKLLDEVFFCEFGYRYDRPSENSKFRALKNQLIEKYTKEILSRLSK